MTPHPPAVSIPDVNIAVLLACHNRKTSTLACLQRLEMAVQRAGLRHQIYLFDDGSTDGTAQAVLQEHPHARIVQGDGQQFWNRSMHAIFALAQQQTQPGRPAEPLHDAYLWLNDDTMLHPEALELLLQAHAGTPHRIVVGAVCDARTGQMTYGGMHRVEPRWRPFLYEPVQPTGTPAHVGVMNGNVVLIPQDVARRLGNIDPTFEHGMGDIDYALRASRTGCHLVQTGDYVGTCSRNPVGGTHHDRHLPVHQRIRYAFSRKGLPLRSWWLMCRRHGGPLFLVHFLWGYLRIVLMKVKVR